MKGPPLPAPAHATINEVLAAAARHPSGLTFVDLHEQESALSWGELHARAGRAAAALQSLGVGRGDRVALVLPTGPAFVTAFFGVLLAGAVPVPLYPPVRLGRLAEYHAATAQMLLAVGALLVLSDARTRRLLGEAVERARPRLGCLAVERLPAAAAAAIDSCVGADDLALIQFSSGTTVDPRPVALSHRALVAQCAILRSLLPPELGHPQRGVSWLPLYHDMGLIAGPLLAAYYPGPLVLIPPELFLTRPALWLRAIARHRGTVSAAPTFAYALCARRVSDEELAGLDLSSWRLATVGAEPIAPRALAAFARRFAPFGFDPDALCPVYGLAEASLAVTFAPVGRAVRTLGVDPARLAASGEVKEGERAIVSVGSPVPGVEVDVRRPDGSLAPERRVGRIFTRGPSLMSGYFGQREATAAALADGWLDTGDLGFIAEGELYVCGRAKDVIIIRGANHAPQEFEECLAEVEGVRPGCAVALGFVPPGADGEVLLILAERGRERSRPADEAIVQRIRELALERTGIRPHTVELLAPGTLPRTSSGKMRRHEALRRYLAGELSPPARVGAAELAAAVVRSTLAFARARLAPARHRDG